MRGCNINRKNESLFEMECQLEMVEKNTLSCRINQYIIISLESWRNWDFSEEKKTLVQSFFFFFFFVN